MLTGKSGHWKYFSAENAARPGAGFDADYVRVNSAGGRLKHFVTRTLMRLRGMDPDRHKRLFCQRWPAGPVTAYDVAKVGGTPIAYLAANFANTVLTELPRTLLGDKPVFLEIGAGSGYLTYFILRQNTLARSIIVDLPEVLALGRKNLERLGVADRVTFLTPDQAEKIKYFHVALNTASMQEMLPETIAAYFDLLRRKRAIHRSVFYCCNRVEKFLSTEPGNSDATGAVQDVAVRFAEYPWANETVVFDRPSAIHDALGMMPCRERMIML